MNNICLRDYKCFMDDFEDKKYILTKEDPFRIKMNDNIIDLLYEYYKSLMNNSDINISMSILKKLINILELNKYIKNIIISSNNNSFYNIENKEIVINENNINLNNKEKEKNIFIYFMILFHELEHAMQYKTVCEMNNISKEILILSNLIMQTDYIHNLYYKYHDNFANEIDSDLTSVKCLYDFSNKVELINPKLGKALLLMILDDKNNLSFTNNKFGNLLNLYTGLNINTNIFNLDQSNSLYYGLNLNNNNINSINNFLKTEELNEETKLLLK